MGLVFHPRTLLFGRPCRKSDVGCCSLCYDETWLTTNFHPQILWENRKKDDIGNDCLASVDGVDFEITGYTLRNGKPDPEYFSYKFKRAGLRYEIALCIRTSHIVWISGPFKPGVYNDIMIFRRPLGLKTMLEPGERVEADDSYVGECPVYCKCPSSGTTYKKQKKIRARVRMCHEHANERIKNFGAMKARFRHGVHKHGLALRACAVLTQLSMDSGEPLLMRLDDYDDRMTDMECKALFGI